MMMRRRIAEVTFDLISREGLLAATVRRIAKEVGFSTTVVTHYFSDKDDMLLSAYEVRNQIFDQKFNTFFSQDPPDLVGFLAAMCPLNPEDRAAWRAHVAIWDLAFKEEEMLKKIHARIDYFLDQILKFIEVINPDCGDKRHTVNSLFSLVHGISTHLLLDKDAWSQEDIEKAFSKQVASLVRKDA
jgi:AcrR family transcriptional regulator